tara:strand:+ start:5854 stop:6090 length:237 start_codon:yes stop_codon:yes gene_type:complete
MDPSIRIIKNALKTNPIGETDNCVWFISEIGIIALCKSKRKIEFSKIEVEALEIFIDLSKEEKEKYEIEGSNIYLFYS